MSEVYALYEGAFGRAIVIESRTNLVPHSHSESQIAFWLGGARAQARVGSELVQYDEGIGLATNAYQSHDMTLLDSKGAAIFLVFSISHRWLNERRKLTGRRFVFPSPRIPIDSALRQACWRALDLIQSAQEPRSLMDDEVERLISAAIDAAAGSGGASNERLVPPSLDHRLRVAIALMRDHITEKITIEEIAGKVGLSRAHFFALFRDQLNTTPQIFWSAVRVEEAMRRLINQGEPLTWVALDLGFSAPGNFSRFFKEHTGVSPSTFRRAATGGLPAAVTGLAD
jgi:AraC-like DNA-binding protein